MILKQDFDLKLVILVLIAIGAIVGLTLFYQSSASLVVGKCEEISDNLEETTTNLTITSADLSECMDYLYELEEDVNETKGLQEEVQEEFNELFVETEIELEDTLTNLEDAEVRIDFLEDEVDDAENNLEECQIDKADIQDTIDDYEDKADSVNEKLSELEDALEDCTVVSCIGEVLDDEFGDLQDKVDELKELS